MPAAHAGQFLRIHGPVLSDTEPVATGQIPLIASANQRRTSEVFSSLGMRICAIMPVYKTEVNEIVLEPWIAPLDRFRGQTMLLRSYFGQTILPARLLTGLVATKNQALAPSSSGKGMLPTRQNYDSSHTFTRLWATNP